MRIRVHPWPKSLLLPYPGECLQFHASDHTLSIGTSVLVPSYPIGTQSGFVESEARIILPSRLQRILNSRFAALWKVQ